MAAVVDAESEDPATNPTAEELKLSLGTCSAGPGTQLSQRVAVRCRLLLRSSVFDDSNFKLTSSVGF